MLKYLLKRFLQMIPILLGITFLTFALFYMVGGDPALRFAGRHATAEQVERIREELGLNQSLAMQYWHFCQQIVKFEWGRSWASHQDINQMIIDGLDATLSLTLPSFIASTLFCILLALLASFYRGSWLDRGVVVTCLGLMSVSSLVYILVFQYLFAYKMNMFPISGWDPSLAGRWEYLLLPWVILFSLNLGPDILIYRSVLRDETHQDYVRTARAKGLPEWRVQLMHVLKNAMIPILTVILIQMPFLITGTVLIENFFALPGLGGMLVKALNESDFPVIKALTVLLSIAYMGFNLLADVLYSILDPRIRLS